MTSWWVLPYIENEAWIPLFSWAFWVIVSITLHELGHGWAAVRQGDRTPIERGHMTLNPLVHMGGPSLLIFIVFGIAWGAMPVNPSRFRQRRLGEALVALAGPAVNFGLAVICVLGAAATIRLMDGATSFARNVEVFLTLGAFLNLALLGFNLLPVPPLDGSRVLAAGSRRARIWFSHPNAQFGLFIVLAIAFFATPAGDYFFGWCMEATLTGIESAGRAIGLESDDWLRFVIRFTRAF